MKQSHKLLLVMALSAIHLCPFISKASSSINVNNIHLADRPIKGKVTAENGAPLANVNILVKGTSNGTISDADGNFSISIPDQGATLVFSFVGYLQKQVTVNKDRKSVV